MKRLFFLLLCSAYGIAFAQTSYVTLTKDIDVDRGGKTVKLFTGSTLQQVTDTLFIKVTEATNTDNNKKGKVVKDAIFPVLTKGNDKKNTHFRDAAGKERHDAGIDFYYVHRILYGSDTLIIDHDNLKVVENVSHSVEDVKSDIRNKSIHKNGGVLFVKSSNQIKGIVLDDKDFKKSTDGSVTVPDYRSQSVRVIMAEDIPDVCLTSNEFALEQSRPEEKTLLDILADFFIDYWLHMLIGLFLVALAVVGYIYIKSGDESKDGEEDIDIQENHGNEKKKKEGKSKKDSHVSSTDLSNGKEASSDLSINDIQLETKKVEDLLKNVESSLKTVIVTEVAKINNKNEDSKKIAKLEENNKTLTREKEELTKKNKEEEEATKKAQKEAETWESKCSELEKDLARAKVVPEDVIALSKYGAFVSFAQNLLSLCEKAEKDVLSFIRSLDDKDRSKLTFFLSEYTLRMPMAARSMWSAVIEGLNVSGYIKNPELVKYLKNQNEAERLKFIQKHFYDDVLISYLSSLVVLLESVRTCDKLNVTTKPSFDCSKVIREIVSLCKQNNITIAYLPLFENLKDEDYDSIEISESLPNAISDQLGNQLQGQPLFVSQYAINSDISEKTQKTKCVVKM